MIYNVISEITNQGQGAFKLDTNQMDVLHLLCFIPLACVSVKENDFILLVLYWNGTSDAAHGRQESKAFHELQWICFADAVTLLVL